MNSEELIRQLKDEKNKLLDIISRKETEERLNKVPANFVQFSRTAMKNVRTLAEKSTIALKILMVLGEKMDKKNAIIISQKALCQLLNVSRQSVYNSMKLLEKEKWIKTMKIGTANAYFLNEQVFWSTDTQKRRYAEFSATVITTEGEQEMSAEDWDAIETKTFPFINNKKERIIVANQDLDPPDQRDIDLD